MSEYYESRTSTPQRVITPEERQMQQINAIVNSAMQAAQARQQQEIANLQKKHETERKKLEKKLNSLNSQFRDNIVQHQQRLIQMQQQYDTQLSQAVANAERLRNQDRIRLERDLHNAIDSVNATIENLCTSTQHALDATNREIENLRVSTNHSLHEQQVQINNIVSEVHNDKAKAASTRHVLEDACNEQLSIVRSKNYQKYAPNQLDAITARVEGMALPDESACAVLHSAYIDLLTLDANIEQARMAYEAKHIITLKAAEEVLIKMNENRNGIVVTDGENNELIDAETGEVVKIELDFWTEGEYSKLERRLKSIKDNIINGLDNPQYTMDDLGVALNEIETIDQLQTEMVIESIQRGKASQIRANMGDIIEEYLGNQRYRVLSSDYENHDQRNAYIIKLTDGNSKIVFIINPENNEDNSIVSRIIDSDLPEPQKVALNQDVVHILEDAGLITSNGGCRRHDHCSDVAWNQIYDFDVVNQEIPSEMKLRAGLRDTHRERTKLG